MPPRRSARHIAEPETAPDHALAVPLATPARAQRPTPKLDELPTEIINHVLVAHLPSHTYYDVTDEGAPTSDPTLFQLLTLSKAFSVHVKHQLRRDVVLRGSKPITKYIEVVDNDISTALSVRCMRLQTSPADGVVDVAVYQALTAALLRRTTQLQLLTMDALAADDDRRQQTLRALRLLADMRQLAIGHPGHRTTRGLEVSTAASLLRSLPSLRGFACSLDATADDPPQWPPIAQRARPAWPIMHHLVELVLWNCWLTPSGTNKLIRALPALRMLALRGVNLAGRKPVFRPVQLFEGVIAPLRILEISGHRRSTAADEETLSGDAAHVFAGITALVLEDALSLRELDACTGNSLLCLNVRPVVDAVALSRRILRCKRLDRLCIEGDWPARDREYLEVAAEGVGAFLWDGLNYGLDDKYEGSRL